MLAKSPSLPAGTRVLLSLILPVLGAILLSGIVSRSFSYVRGDQSRIALQLAGAGLVSWFIGVRWYGLTGMGLRGGRPLYAGIGFAVLAWLAFILVRLAVVRIGSFGSPDSGRAFIYLLLFEAFSAQLWSFGLFFRSAADWRGPLTAAIASGIVFGAIAFIFFQESFVASLSSLLYFTVWGILYGVIRLRTGSFLGMVAVQTMQSWTAWQVMVPLEQPDASQLRNLYLISSALYLLIIWRLWPRREEDYRL